MSLLPSVRTLMHASDTTPVIIYVHRYWTLKCHDAADGLSSFEGCKAIIDLAETDTLGNHGIETQLPIEISLRQEREIAGRTGAAIARPPDALLLHQRAP